MISLRLVSVRQSFEVHYSSFVKIVQGYFNNVQIIEAKNVHSFMYWHIFIYCIDVLLKNRTSPQSDHTPQSAIFD